MLRDQGKCEQAEEMFRQALRLRETVLGKEHPDTLTSMYNLAYVLSNRERFSEANELYQRALNSYACRSHGCRPKPARAIPVQGLRHLTAATLLICVSMAIIESYCFYVFPCTVSPECGI